MPDIAAAAREWCGTPFAWGQSCKGVGADCKGFLAGVARECGRHEARSFEALYVGYGQRAQSEKLLAGVERLFDRVQAMAAGDVLLISIAGKPQHLAIYLGGGMMAHAYIKPPRRVIEVPVKGWKIHSIWRWRDVS